MTSPENFINLCRTCGTLTVEPTRQHIFKNEDLLQKLSSVCSYLSIKISREDSLPHVVCPGCVNELNVVYEFIKHVKTTETELNKIVETEILEIKKEKIDEDEENSNSESIEWVVPKQEEYEPQEIDPSLLLKQSMVCSDQEIECPDVPRTGLTSDSLLQLDSLVNTIKTNSAPLFPPMRPLSSSSMASSDEDDEQSYVNFVDIQKPVQIISPSVNKGQNKFILPKPDFSLNQATTQDKFILPKPDFSSLNQTTPQVASIVCNASVSNIQGTSYIVLPPQSAANMGIQKLVISSPPIIQNSDFKAKLAGLKPNILKRNQTKSAVIAQLGQINNYNKSSSPSTKKSKPKTKTNVSQKQLENLAFQHTLTDFEKSVKFKETHCKTKNKCFTCYIAYPTKDDLIKHRLDHTKNLHCRFCKLDFHSNDELMTHYNSKEHEENFKNETKKWKCGVCDKNYCFKVVAQHVKNHTNLLTYACTKCPLKFASGMLRYDHERKVHKPRDFTCDLCGKGFFDKCKFKIHFLQAHTNERPFKCNSCTAGFVSKVNLAAHMKCMHADPSLPIVTHKCDVCEKIYRTRSSLLYHLLSHKDKQHVCNICGTSYVAKRSLRLHMAKHTGEGKLEYICDECGKSLTTSQSLEEHLLRHAGVKNFVCDVCGKSFTTKITLKVHARTHTDERPYQCRVCTKRFTQRSTIVSHMKKQHNIDDRVRKFKD